MCRVRMLREDVVFNHQMNVRMHDWTDEGDGGWRVGREIGAAFGVDVCGRVFGAKHVTGSYFDHYRGSKLS